jgi:hypothetical protein
MVIAISATMIIAIDVSELAVAVAVAIDYDNGAAITAEAGVVPISGDPEAVVVVAGYPNVASTRARRNVGRRPTNNHSHFGCMGRGRSKAQPASHYRCTQHKFAKVFHNSSVLLL